MRLTLRAGCELVTDRWFCRLQVNTGQSIFFIDYGLAQRPEKGESKFDLVLSCDLDDETDAHVLGASLIALAQTLSGNLPDWRYEV